ncbi:MAG: hypothetical protein HRT57_06110 [Crocinitomicaceae bacterium]|nr:hypothetical protein [Crocinitomicaceae bacterium]
MNKERNKIEDTMNMGDHVQHVTPSSDLMNRLKAIPSQVKQGYDTIPKKIVWMAAASIVLLIGLNLLSLNEYKDSQSDTPSTETVDDSYLSYMKNV